MADDDREPAALATDALGGFSGAVRDANTDAFRLGQGAVDRGPFDAGPVDCAPLTLEDQAMAGGWGGVNDPCPTRDDNTGRVAGMRGEPDMDSDVGEKPYPANGEY